MTWTNYYEKIFLCIPVYLHLMCCLISLNCFCFWNKERKTTTCSIHTWKMLQWQICFVRLVGFVKIATDGALLVSHCCCHLASRSTLWQPVCLLARALCSNELTRHVGLPLFCAFACGAVRGVSFALVRINNGRLTKVMTFSLNHHNVLYSSNCDLICCCIDGLDIAIVTYFLATGIVSQFFHDQMRSSLANAFIH